MTRKAISPRLAMRMRLNMEYRLRRTWFPSSAWEPAACEALLRRSRSGASSSCVPKRSLGTRGTEFCIPLAAGIHLKQRFVEFDRFAVFAQHGDDLAADLGRNLVEDLHRLDDADHCRRIDAVPDLHVRLSLGVGTAVER